MLMDYDLIFVVGLVIGAFTIPALVSAYADRRAPRLAALFVIISGGMIAYAAHMRAEPYELDQLDDVVLAVLARWVN